MRPHEKCGCTCGSSCEVHQCSQDRVKRRPQKQMEGIVHDIDRTQLEIQETGYETPEFEFQPEIGGELGMESPFSEAEEMELAAELLGISSEEELDHFLGKLISG